jgi:hypothetical protein
VDPAIFQGFYAHVEVLPAAAMEARLNALLLEMPALAALRGVPRAHLHVNVMADALPVVEQEGGEGAGNGLGDEWDGLADLLQGGLGLVAAAGLAAGADGAP